MSREIKGKFMNLIDGNHKSTPVIITPNIPPCHSNSYAYTRKIRSDTIVVTHTNEKGEISFAEHIVKKRFNQ